MYINCRIKVLNRYGWRNPGRRHVFYPGKGKTMRRLFLLTDKPRLLKKLKKLCGSSDSVSLCGYGEYGEMSFDSIHKLNPDILLMSYSLPVEVEQHLVRFIHQCFPNIKMLIISEQSDPQSAESYLLSGAHGFIVERDLEENLDQAIHLISKDGFFASDNIANMIIEQRLKKTY